MPAWFAPAASGLLAGCGGGSAPCPRGAEPPRFDARKRDGSAGGRVRRPFRRRRHPVPLGPHCLRRCRRAHHRSITSSSVEVRGGRRRARPCSPPAPPSGRTQTCLTCRRSALRSSPRERAGGADAAAAHGPHVPAGSSAWQPANAALRLSRPCARPSPHGRRSHCRIRGPGSNRGVEVRAGSTSGGDGAAGAGARSGVPRGRSPLSGRKPFVANAAWPEQQ